MATPARRAFAAQHHTSKRDPRKPDAVRLTPGRSCRPDEGPDRACPQQKIRRSARLVTDGELDFVFRL